MNLNQIRILKKNSIQVHILLNFKTQACSKMDSRLSSRRYSFKQFENLTLDIYSFSNRGKWFQYSNVHTNTFHYLIIQSNSNQRSSHQQISKIDSLRCDCHCGASQNNLNVTLRSRTFCSKIDAIYFPKNLSWCVNDAAVPDVSNFQCEYLHEIETDFRILKYLNTGSRSVNFMKKK